MVFTVTVDRDEDGVWVVECPSIPGCVSHGKTKEEALENVKDAIKLCLEVRGEKDIPLTIEIKQQSSVKRTWLKFLKVLAVGCSQITGGGARKVIQ
jgi:predicted RNase H-like HicB family nuclease